MNRTYNFMLYRYPSKDCSRLAARNTTVSNFSPSHSKRSVPVFISIDDHASPVVSGRPIRCVPTNPLPPITSTFFICSPQTFLRIPYIHLRWYGDKLYTVLYQEVWNGDP